MVAPVMPEFGRRFDPAETWSRLPPELQQRLGLLAMTIGCAMSAEPYASPAGKQLCDAAAGESVLELVRIYRAVGHDASAVNVHGHGAHLRPDLNRIGIRSCDSCGCTDQFGCPGICHWTGPATCSTCAPAPRAPR